MQKTSPKKAFLRAPKNKISKAFTLIEISVVILIIGILVARWIGKLVLRQLSKKDMEPPVRMLIVRMIKLVIIAFTLVLVLEKVGVSIAPLVAGIGVAGIDSARQRRVALVVTHLDAGA